MRTTIAYLTSVLVHLGAVVGLACYMPTTTNPRLNVESGLTIVASFAVATPEAEPEAAVVLEDMQSKPLPQEAQLVKPDMAVSPSATQLVRKEVDVHDVIPIQAQPADKDETPPPQTGAKQSPQSETPLAENASKVQAAKQTKASLEIAQHSIAMPPQSAVSNGAVDRLPREFPSNRKPSYPAEEARAGITGLVRIKCMIAASGQVQSAAVDRTSGSVRLDEAALVAVRTWRFEPAQRGGVAVPIEVIVPFNFFLR